jgi:hypothetical protein
LSHRYCYLPLSWKSWNWFECAVSGVRHPQHTHFLQAARLVESRAALLSKSVLLWHGMGDVYICIKKKLSPYRAGNTPSRLYKPVG